MTGFIIAFIVALAVSALGFKKYIWFISLGYGFAVAGIGVLLLVLFRGQIDLGLLVACILLVIYGCRLGGYLAYREAKISTYNKKMVGEIKDGSGMSFGLLCAIWVPSARL